MRRTVSAAEVNRSFSRLLREVREAGAEVIVTAHGKPVAVLAPLKVDVAARMAAREALCRRLAAQPAIDAGQWTRDELYDR
jgi:prevent-host-death family protein